MDKHNLHGLYESMMSKINAEGEKQGKAADDHIIERILKAGSSVEGPKRADDGTLTIDQFMEREKPKIVMEAARDMAKVIKESDDGVADLDDIKGSTLAQLMNNDARTMARLSAYSMIANASEMGSLEFNNAMNFGRELFNAQIDRLARTRWETYLKEHGRAD